MKRIKILALIGIIISVFGLLGSLLSDDAGVTFLGILIYGFLLWFSIEVRSAKKIIK